MTNASLDPKITTVQEAVILYKNKGNFSAKKTRDAYTRAGDLFLIFLQYHYDFEQGPAALSKKCAKDKKADKLLVQDIVFKRIPDGFSAEAKEFSRKMRVSELSPGWFLDFHKWLRETVEYKPRTLATYTAGLSDMLGFFFSRRSIQMPFPESELSEKLQKEAKRINKRIDPSATSKKIDDQYGPRMWAAVTALPPIEIPPGDPNYRKLQLERLRMQALIATLYSTGMRISDAVRLQRATIERIQKYHEPVALKTLKTDKEAIIAFTPEKLQVVQDYLDFRDDVSPYIFIQHGRDGNKIDHGGGEGQYLDTVKTRGYGARISERTAWSIVKEVELAAGYYKHKPGGGLEKTTTSPLGPHSFRHWLAKNLKKQGLRIEHIQDVLGHSTAQTTKVIYAPEADTELIRKSILKVIEGIQEEDA